MQLSNARDKLERAQRHAEEKRTASQQTINSLSLSPPTTISLDGLGLPRKSEDAYHFVVYLPFMGSVYELDGLKEHLVTHGPYEDDGEGWVKRARFVVSAGFSLVTDYTGKLSRVE